MTHDILTVTVEINVVGTLTDEGSVYKKHRLKMRRSLSVARSCGLLIRRGTEGVPLAPGA
jgi:hypothetical protein